MRLPFINASAFSALEAFQYISCGSDPCPPCSVRWFSSFRKFDSHIPIIFGVIDIFIYGTYLDYIHTPASQRLANDFTMDFVWCVRSLEAFKLKTRHSIFVLCTQVSNWIFAQVCVFVPFTIFVLHAHKAQPKCAHLLLRDHRIASSNSSSSPSDGNRGDKKSTLLFLLFSAFVCVPECVYVYVSRPFALSPTCVQKHDAAKCAHVKTHVKFVCHLRAVRLCALCKLA